MNCSCRIVSLVAVLLIAAHARAQEGTDPVTVNPDVDPTVRPRRTLTECVRLALEHSPSVDGAAAASEEATAMRRSARGRFGPVVRLDANLLRWNAPFSLPLDIPVPAFEPSIFRSPL